MVSATVFHLTQEYVVRKSEEKRTLRSRGGKLEIKIHTDLCSRDNEHDQKKKK